MNIKKLLIFAGLGLVVVGGGGAGAYFFLQKSGDHGTEQTQTQGPVHAAEPPRQQAVEPPRQPAQANANYSDAYEDDGSEVIAVTQSHTINLPGGSTNRSSFLKCKISILVRDTELGKVMASDTPTPESEGAKATVLDALSALTMEDVLDQDVRSILKQDILDGLNTRFRNRPPLKDKKAPPRPQIPIKEVLVVEWAVQY